MKKTVVLTCMGIYAYVQYLYAKVHVKDMSVLIVQGVLCILDHVCTCTSLSSERVSKL